jgi:uncharacterized protein (TIGR02147 family)
MSNKGNQEREGRAKSNQKMGLARPNIFSYHDYRKFLTDYLEHQKHTRPGFSMRKLSRDLNIASGYLPMVLSGERQLSKEALTVMLPVMALSKTEQKFFQALHDLGSARSRELRLEALGRMKKFIEYRKHNPDEALAYEYLTHWYYVAIRELAATPDFKAEPEWIQKRLRFRLTLKEIKDALEFLFSKGYLLLRENGKIELAEKNINCMDGIFRISLAQFHKQMLMLADQSLDKATEFERKILGHTFAVPASRYQRANAIIEEAFKKMQELEKETTSEQIDTVLHTTFAVFPLTQKGKGK